VFFISFLSLSLHSLVFDVHGELDLVETRVLVSPLSLAAPTSSRSGLFNGPLARRRGVSAALQHSAVFLKFSAVD
jgi:hypothetical protein